jgi:hypothetical protein
MSEGQLDTVLVCNWEGRPSPQKRSYKGQLLTGLETLHGGRYERC